MLTVGRHLIALSIGVGMVLAGPALAQPGLEYRDRGNRHEGLRALPVSGETIELLAFQAAYNEAVPSAAQPATYHVKFFLNEPAAAFVVVREVTNRHSYWLDRVQPPKWPRGFDNVFEWPATDVVSRIPLAIADLGVVVRLDGEALGLSERVAPALLYQSLAPTSVTQYSIVFKMNVVARLEFIVQQADGTAVRPAPEPHVVSRWSFGVPIRVAWDARKVPAGEYRLVVNGRNLENNETFSKVVKFIHRPEVQ